MSYKVSLFVIVLIVGNLLLMLLSLMVGSVDISISDFFNLRREDSLYYNIIVETRLPSVMVAFLTGVALSISGLLLQTLFQNPLAGPSILGISSGANLGVAISLLIVGVERGGLFSGITTTMGAFVGSSAVLFLIILLSARIKNSLIILIIGIMIEYVISSVVVILQYFADKQSLQSFVIWGMGDFSKVALNDVPLYAIFVVIGSIGAIILIKPLNTLNLGVEYAHNLGTSVKRTRIIIFLVTGLLVAVATAYCGPIAFIGLVVPHLAKMLLRSVDHTSLVPITILTGGAFALIGNILSKVEIAHSPLPLNAVMPLISIPIIIFVLLKQYKG